MQEDDQRFRHHPYLRAVALEDVRLVTEKDRSYGASWKAAGGTSAWFMLRRKIDRMLEMMRRPQPPASFNFQNVEDTVQALHEGRSLPGSPEATAGMLDYLRRCVVAEDIFGRIQSENPEGPDGTVLAEVRDLRRYLLLVEAEMVARGAVAAPPGEDGDVYAEAASRWGMSREAAKKRIYEAILGIEPRERVARAEAERRSVAVPREEERVFGSYVDDRGQVRRTPLHRPGTPEDGGHHESVGRTPGKDEGSVGEGARYSFLVARGRAAHLEGRKNWQEVVRRANRRYCTPPLAPEEIDSLVRNLEAEFGAAEALRLPQGQAPVAVVDPAAPEPSWGGDRYPLEVNDLERSELPPEVQATYRWYETTSKWVMEERYRLRWCRDYAPPAEGEEA